MKKFFKDIVTDYDNKTYDTARAIGVWSVCFLSIAEAVNVFFLGNQFDAFRWASAVTAILAGTGVAVLSDNARRPDAKRMAQKDPE